MRKTLFFGNTIGTGDVGCVKKVHNCFPLVYIKSSQLNLPPTSRTQCFMFYLFIFLDRQKSFCFRFVESLLFNKSTGLNTF